MNKPKINDSYNDKKSYVAKDQIWKDHVTKSTLSARKWPEIWGFMHETVINSFKFDNLVCLLY